jgi:fructosamine-3-kinase
VSLPDTARARIEAIAGAPIIGSATMHGGDIAAVWRADLADGRTLVAKSGANLAIEGWMLGYLKEHTRAPVPEVYHADDDLLLMELIGNDGTLDPFAETHLGDVIAALHAHEGVHFGLGRDTVIGGLPQINTETDDWREFFRDRRLLAMARNALDAGRLPGAVMTRVEKLCGRLHVWIRNESRPLLIHGDLWSGNILSRNTKIVGLIDPAIYYADPEIELAFMTLFNSVGKKFFARYARHRPLREGFFEERRDLYNLYPLLVHVRLFGGAYVAQVERTLARYGS